MANRDDLVASADLPSQKGECHLLHMCKCSWTSNGSGRGRTDRFRSERAWTSLTEIDRFWCKRAWMSHSAGRRSTDRFEVNVNGQVKETEEVV